LNWVREGLCLPPTESGQPDSDRAWRPWVLEEEEGTFRMWYSGHDGTTWRIMEALQKPGGGWERQGVSIDVGFAGDTDDYGVQAPCVVRTRGGYLMAYAGFDGEVTRLHMATSQDGHEWSPLGTFLQRGEEDTVGASHPSLLITGTRWWLFFSGYDGTGEGRKASVLAAVSESGASWDRLGPVLVPELSEVSASHPCVIDIARDLHMFYASDNGKQVGIALATSRDGVNWDRRGVVLPPSGDGPDSLATHAPCVIRMSNGSLKMWYSALPLEDTQFAYRICSATLSHP
jgi:predicted GH43/DUF377 family glycosyl hydrolase